MAKTSEEILQEINKLYSNAQNAANAAKQAENDSYAELQHYANACYKKYQQICLLVESNNITEAENLLLEPVEY